MSESDAKHADYLKVMKRLDRSRGGFLAEPGASVVSWTRGDSRAHRVIAITGLSSSGKDSLLTDLYIEYLASRSDFHFPTKIISREPRPEEIGEDSSQARDMPYLVRQANATDLEKNQDDKFFSVYHRYGNVAGFLLEDLHRALRQPRPSTIVYIQPEVERIADHCDEVSRIIAAARPSQEQAKNPALPDKLELVLIDASVEVCKSRLKRRNLPSAYRQRRFAGIEGDWIAVDRIREHDGFDCVVENSNENAFNAAKRDLLIFLVDG